MTSNICVSIKPKNIQEALILIEKAEGVKADFIEVRLDDLGEGEAKLGDLSASTRIPLIATNKLLNENGSYMGTSLQRWQTLLDAANSGFQYVDLELSTVELEKQIIHLKELGVKSIVSFHKFDGSFSSREMCDILDREIGSGADVCKIVGTAKQVQDNFVVLDFVSENAARTRLVCFCMGKYGRISRLLSPVFGAFFTFAALEQGSETAPGQISINEMRAVYSLLRQ
ncbi:MAG: type I 3-dehydroquinate dehydratase [Candidatus Bathyarchaeota archaeon]|nr:type I 3-dehydroquinate dehydratase [Candidatus Termiticorpusculum sp.]MCL1971064.1 type I 3-dehydroquinate dehydratase [Candidatus Termiticorpusculum sp.]